MNLAWYLWVVGRIVEVVDESVSEKVHCAVMKRNSGFGQMEQAVVVEGKSRNLDLQS